MNRLRPQKDGQPIGPKRTISAASVAELLGLKGAPAPEPPIPDSPAAARLRSEGNEKAADALMEEAKATHKESVIPAGWGVAEALALKPEDLPVGVEQELGPRPKRPRGEEGWQGDGSYDATVKPKPEAPSPSPGDAAELAREFRVHAKRVSELAESAKASGDPAREARAAEEVAASREVGERLKEAGVL